jgi:DNA repair protein RadA/Sms
MPRPSVKHVCQQCGYESLKWLGRCPDCSAWSSFVEEVTAPAPAGGGRGGGFAVPNSKPVPLSDVSLAEHRRIGSGIGEFDRVLGGGIVPGSLVLIGGDPGIGKSTLLMQVAGKASGAGRVLYVTGEESASQVKLRADRLGVSGGDVMLATETDMDQIEAHVGTLKPRFLVIDSIQTMNDASLTSAPATVSQVRQCTSRLMRLAKSGGTTIFLVGHVTKEGAIAGPRVLEHMVDTVLYFEGDRFQAHRILRAVKNRFGSTDELGIFEMGDGGLREVPNPSEVLLAERPQHGPGSAVSAIIEGTRPLLVEVQALVAPSTLAAPRRMTTGVDPARVAMIVAVLEKRAGLRMGDKDIYVNIAGGLKLKEPAVDLAVAIALASSYRDLPVKSDIVVAGEVGLAGEVRAVSQSDLRMKEAARMGFTGAILAASGRARGKDPLAVERVSLVRDALDRALVESDDPFTGAPPFEELVEA